MAKLKIPDPLARRHLLEGTLDPAKARAIGEAYLAEEREVEAVDFLARGDARDALEALRQAAEERGDVFLRRVVAAALDEEPSAEAWTRLSERASAMGRERDAETARRLATVEA